MSLSDALTRIDKQFGKGSIFKLGDKEVIGVPTISTGVVGIDELITGSGFPRGRVVEIYGPESSGKTTLALQVVAEAQKIAKAEKSKSRCAIVDAEHALDTVYAGRLGVDVDELLVSQPDYGEQGLEIAEALVRSGEIDVLVIDSVAALVPKAELDGEMGAASMGLQARLMSQALRKLTGVVSKSNTCLIFINQLRDKIGVMFGSPETTTGGKALKFYASVRVDVRRLELIKEGDVATGARTKIKIVKNKVGTPFKEGVFDMVFGLGFSKEADLLARAEERGIVDKSGSWYSYKTERLAQGRLNVIQLLRDNSDIYESIKKELLK